MSRRTSAKRTPISRHVSSSALDYDEPSSDEDPLAMGLTADLEADEELLLNTALEASLESARDETAVRTGTSSGGAGSSKTARNPAAALRALAAERRLRRASNMQVDDALDSDTLDALDEEMSDLTGSETESDKDVKAKGKGKSKAKKQTKITPAKNHSVHTIAELARIRKEKRAEKAIDRAAERALAKKLGRKVTQSEKTMLKLRKHHEGSCCCCVEHLHVLSSHCTLLQNCVMFGATSRTKFQSRSLCGPSNPHRSRSRCSHSSLRV